MAQPTIYADIDCDGQVEVKINNDTGYPCTLITSTGVNESIPSTGTNVIRNYNLTSSDWVKVVAAQDATIAANKLTGTIKYITSVTTTTPTPTTTTTTTPAGGSPISGGVDCDNPAAWPSYGTQYKLTGSMGGEWFELAAGYQTRTITVVGGDNLGIEYWIGDACSVLQAPGGQTYSTGVLISTLPSGIPGSTTLRFHITNPGQWDVTIT